MPVALSVMDIPGLGFLLGSLIALIVGPLLYRLAGTSTAIVSGLDAFVFVGIGDAFEPRDHRPVWA